MERTGRSRGGLYFRGRTGGFLPFSPPVRQPDDAGTPQFGIVGDEGKAAGCGMTGGFAVGLLFAAIRGASSYMSAASLRRARFLQRGHVKSV